jgi:tetratricopeptide (TPR) repeat protein
VRFFFACLGSPLFALTSVFREAFLATSMAIAGSAVAVALTAGRRPRTGLAALLAALAAWTALQCIPLPCAFVRALAPLSADAAARVARLTGASATCTISRAPGATWEALTLGCVLASVAAAASLVVAREGRAALGRALTIVATMLAATALAHLALASPAIYGVYLSPHAHPLLPSPLINPNHLALVATMGAMFGTHFALSTHTPPERAAWTAATVVCVVAGVLSMSRAGIASAVVGPLAVALLHRRSGAVARKFAVPWSVGVVGTVLLGLGAVAAESLYAAYAEGGLSKFALARAASVVVLEAPWVGVGRGAFASAFAPHAPSTERYLYPENLVVQWTSEWGVPVGILAMGTLLVGLCRAARQAQSPLRLTAVACTAMIALHECVDFATEMLGPATLAVCVLVTALHPEGGEPLAGARVPRMPWLDGRVLAVASGICAIVVGVAVAVGAPERPETLVRRTSAAAGRGAPELATTLVSAVRAYPSDPTVALLGATWAVRAGAPRAGAWLNAAMELAPGWHSSHLLAAEWLLRGGRIGQALLELRESASREPQRTARFVCAWVQRGAGVDQALAAMPREPAQAALTYLDVLATCLSGRPSDAHAVDVALLERDPRHARALTRVARRANRRGEAGESLALLERAVASATEPELRLELVDALLAMGQAERASAALAPLLGERSPRVIEREATIAARRGDLPRMRALFEELRSVSTDSTEALHGALMFVGRTEASIGRDERALAAFAEAHRLTGSNDALRSVARSAERLGDRARALHAYTTLCSEGMQDGCENADRLRRSIERPR